MVISEVSLKLECATKTKMTKLMKTSCAALDRLLNPDNDSLTLSTLEGAIASGKFWTKFYIKYRRGKELMVLDLLHRLVTSFYPERVNIYTLKNAIEIPFLGTCSNEKCFYTLGVPISRPLYFNLI